LKAENEAILAKIDERLSPWAFPKLSYSPRLRPLKRNNPLAAPLWDYWRPAIVYVRTRCKLPEFLSFPVAKTIDNKSQHLL